MKQQSLRIGGFRGDRTSSCSYSDFGSLIFLIGWSDSWPKYARWVISPYAFPLLGNCSCLMFDLPLPLGLHTGGPLPSDSPMIFSAHPLNCLFLAESVRCRSDSAPRSPSRFSPSPLRTPTLLCYKILPSAFPISESPTSKFHSFPTSFAPRLRLDPCCFAHLARPRCPSSPSASFQSKTSQICRSENSKGSDRERGEIGMPITLVSLKRARGSRLSECRKESRTRLSAINNKVEEKEAMLLATKDDEGNQTESEKDALHSEILSSKVLTLPTILTLGRVAAIPVLLIVFYSNEWWATAVVAGIFVLAAITDWLDGYLARKMGSNSVFGAFLDPVADKLMVATTLVLLCTKPVRVPWAAAFPWLIPLPATAIIGREITMSAVREWAATQGGDLRAAVAVNNLGKWKTAAQMVALTVLLATRDGSQNGLAGLLVAVGVGMLYFSAGLALWSLAVYMKGIWGALIK